MKNKLIFRVIGALFSSLIIISVFMPFTNVDSNSLWDSYRSLDMIYLPIMIIVFGSIGVIFFSLNIKTEFAYATSGAIIFFTVMQLVQAINYNTVDSLGLGFYFLAVGGVITGLMAFLSNLKGRSIQKVAAASEMPQMSTINVEPQSMDLMGNQTIANPTLQTSNIVESNISPVNEINNDNAKVPTSVPEIQNDNINLSGPSEINVQQQNIGANNLSNVVPPVQVPINNEPITDISPIPEITPQASEIQPSINYNNAQSNVSVNNVPNTNPQVNAETVQNVNPVLREFQQIGPQEQVRTSNSFVQRQNTVPANLNNPSQANVSSDNSNMQGLDIFGNFK
jgi:hypothetical protein